MVRIYAVVYRCAISQRQPTAEGKLKERSRGTRVLRAGAGWRGCGRQGGGGRVVQKVASESMR